VAREAAEAEARRFGRAAGLLSIGIGSAGLLTYVYFSLASHILNRADYGHVVVLWSAVFITISTLFRPVEQLLSRTIAERQARAQPIGQPLRVAARIQLVVAIAFAVCALALRDPLQNHLYAVLLLAESTARVSFALAVAVGIASGQTAVALGIVAAPLLSLMVVPLAFAHRARSRAAPAGPGAAAGQAEFTLASGSGFAAAVLLIMISEQSLLNAGPLLVKTSDGAAAAGFIFNVLMLARAPLVLFQAVATSLLPHLTRLRSSADPRDAEAFQLSIRMTIRAIVIFASAVGLIVLIAGPQLMQLAFGEKFSYDRVGLLIVTAGMGFYLSSGTLSQAALAQGQVRRAAACWVGCAVAFVGWNLLPVLDEFRRVEVGFAGAAVLLSGLLYLLYRRPRARPEDVVEPGSPQELEARLAAADEAG
jgi:O-antigen/teichoic acid export membrane protein